MCTTDRNSISFGKSGEAAFQELTTIYTPGRDGGTAAVTWILHSDYRGALPTASLVEGWRFRVGDIQIGHNDLLVPLFPEANLTRGASPRRTSLTHRILPNGRRDHFEQNSFYADLLNHLAPHARDVAQRCRASSIERNLLRKVNTGITECEQRLRVLSKGSLSDGAATRLSSQLAKDLDQLQRLSTRSPIAADQQLSYKALIKRLRQRLFKATRDGNGKSPLDSFTPAQRSIIGEVFNAIYAAHSDIEKAQLLIDRILKGVS